MVKDIPSYIFWTQKGDDSSIMQMLIIINNDNPVEVGKL